jgi:hypothetical protein
MIAVFSYVFPSPSQFDAADHDLRDAIASSDDSLDVVRRSDCSHVGFR